MDREKGLYHKALSSKAQRGAQMEDLFSTRVKHPQIEKDVVEQADFMPLILPENMNMWCQRHKMHQQEHGPLLIIIERKFIDSRSKAPYNEPVCSDNTPCPKKGAC